MSQLAVNLSEHFTYAEMIYSPTAIRHGIDNTPPQEARSNLFNLCNKVLEVIRRKLNTTTRISSGFRCKLLNTIIGGSDTSQHMDGKAADINADGLSTEKLFQEIIELAKKGELKFDQ